MIIWIASYPKSGNTWVRTIISSMLFSSDGQFKMSLLKKIPQFPREAHFREVTERYSDIEEVCKHWITAQEKVNQEKKIFFFKTHNANIKIANYSFTNKKNTLATIYIVRDPRNLVSSIANHFKMTNEKAKNFLIENRALKQSIDGKEGVITPITDWGDHYKSWTKHNDNLLLIKYENLIDNIDKEIIRIYEFLKNYMVLHINENKIKKIIETTEFGQLQKLEKEGNFDEYKNREKEFNFFYKGPENNWKNNIAKNISDEIENKYRDTMRNLRYL